MFFAVSAFCICCPQVLIQARKFLFLELAEGLHPVDGVPERSCQKCARTPLCIPTAPHKTCAFKHGEVLGDRVG